MEEPIMPFLLFQALDESQTNASDIVEDSMKVGQLLYAIVIR